MSRSDAKDHNVAMERIRQYPTCKNLSWRIEKGEGEKEDQELKKRTAGKPRLILIYKSLLLLLHRIYPAQNVNIMSLCGENN